MDLGSFLDALPLLLSGNAPTGKGESIKIVEEWKTVMEKIMVELKKDPQLMEKLEYFLSSSSFDDFLAVNVCLQTNSTVGIMIAEYAAKCSIAMQVDTAGRKNATKGASIRQQGNALFAKKEYGLAFKMFTRALMFTTDEDEETPLLYANRSAVYFHLKQYENTLEDIERALKFGYSNLKPAGMLLIRKGFSLLALGRDSEVKELLDVNLPANENEPDFAQWQKLKKESANVNREITKRDIAMSQFKDFSTVSTALIKEDVFRPHERFPWLNAKIDLRYDAEKGYHLVPKEEMKYGEIVAISKPFVSLDPNRHSYERCHYCMVPCFESPKYFSENANLVHELEITSDSLRMVTPLACPECSNVLYCSEACRAAAWTAYHRFECSQMTILRKIDSKAHLALRMLYMIGCLEENSPNVKLMEFTKIADPCALMIDQQAYSYVYNDRMARLLNVEKDIEFALTAMFLTKLVAMSDLLIEPKSLGDRVYIKQLSKGLSFLHLHLYQIDEDETTPFTHELTHRTVTPSPFLSVDGMTRIMKHSCEATVASSSILRDSFESNVKLLHATGDIPAGTVLTLAYNSEDDDDAEQFFVRKYPLFLRYKFKCVCTRCLREERDCLEYSAGIYYPIGCSLCGELMVRAADKGKGTSSLLDDSYRCSSTDGCSFKYNGRQMKYIYELMGKLLDLKRYALHSIHVTYSEFQPKVYKLKRAIESTAQLLYGGSLLLTQLYTRLATDYLLITPVPISNPDLCLFGVDFTFATHTIDRDHLTNGLLYANKALDILEGLKQGAGFKTHLAEELFHLFALLGRTKKRVMNLNQVLFFEVRPLIGQAQSRYEALQKVTDFDTMVAASLCDQE